MLAGIGLAVVLTVILLTLLAERLVRFIPFEVELRLAENFQQLEPREADTRQQRIETYLQVLGDKLAVAQKLPESMPIKVHYVDMPDINAFATLGGHVVIFRGLLERLPNENALSMVLAHEIAHIKHRDPIVALGRGVTVGIAVMSLMGVGDGMISQQLVGNIGLITGLSFSRDQERQADAEALLTLQNYYGHVTAAEVIFELFISEQNGFKPPAFLSTHPLSAERLEAVKAFSSSTNSGQAVDVKPLPEWMAF